MVIFCINYETIHLFVETASFKFPSEFLFNNFPTVSTPPCYSLHPQIRFTDQVFTFLCCRSIAIARWLPRQIESNPSLFREQSPTTLPLTSPLIVQEVYINSNINSNINDNRLNQQSP